MISGETYEELFEILAQMDKQTVMKIPEEILNNIKSRRNKDYKTRIDRNDLFNESNINKETVDLLCWLDYNYWMNESEKDNIKSELIEQTENDNYEKENDLKRQKYNPDIIFTDKTFKELVDNSNEELAEIPKDSFFTKLKNFFSRLFKRG